VLGDEHPPDRRRLDRAEQEARERQRQDVIRVLPSDGRQAQVRQAARHLAQKLHTARVKREDRRDDDAPDHHEQRDRLVFQENLAGDEHRQRNQPQRKRRTVGLVQVFEEVRASFPEPAAVRAPEAEELGQLRAGQEQRHAALEPHHDRLGNEVDDRAGAKEPGDEGDHRHEQGRADGQGAEA
jgi:hypothetical protein